MATGTALPRRGASDIAPPIRPQPPRRRRPGPFAEGRPAWCVAALLVVFILPAALAWVLLAAAGGGR